MAENNLFGTKKPSIRGDTNAFFNKIKQIGESTNKNFTKADGSVDMKKFAKFAKKSGVNLYNKSPSGIIKFNAWFNKLDKNVKYDLVAVDKPGPKKGGAGTGFNTGETKIKQPPGTKGAPSNDKIYTEGEKLNKQALKKFPKSRTERLKFIVDGLYKKFWKYQHVTKKFLTNFVKTGGFKMHPFFLMGDMSMKMMEDPEFTNSIGLGEPKQMTFNQGGMMDIDYMTRPLGMQAGGDPIQERKAMMQKAMTLKEGQRRADMETGDPEMQSDSTYGNMSIEDITKLAMTIAQQQGDSSEENIRQIMRQLSAVLPSLQQDMSNERRSPVASGLNSLIDKFGLNRKTNLDRDVSQYRVR